MIKAKPAGRVPPDAILLSGNKSMQKCLLLAEGYGRSRSDYALKRKQRRRSGPLHKGGLPALLSTWGAEPDLMISSTRQVREVVSFKDCVSGFRCSVPCAAAGSEWIKDDQQNELSEALAEFSFCRLSSFRFREPCNAGQGFGCLLFAYFIWASK